MGDRKMEWFGVENKHSLKKHIEECEKQKMGPKKYGEKILREFKHEMNEIYKK